LEKAEVTSGKRAIRLSDDLSDHRHNLFAVWSSLVARWSIHGFVKVQGRVFQDAWNLLFFSIIAISVAATLNWRNSVWVIGSTG
jgi:hypothetical protein